MKKYRNPPKKIIPYLLEMTKRVKSFSRKFRDIIHELDEFESSYCQDKEALEMLNSQLKRAARDIDIARDNLDEVIDMYQRQPGRPPVWPDVLFGEEVPNNIEIMLSSIAIDFVKVKIDFENQDWTEVIGNIKTMLEEEIKWIFEHFHSIQIDKTPIHLVGLKIHKTRTKSDEIRLSDLWENKD